MWYINGVLTILLDVTLWFIPLPVVFKDEKIFRKENTGVLVVVGTGLLACFASMARIWAVKNATESDDRHWNMSLIYMFDQSEVAFGIMAACMASLRPLVKVKRLAGFVRGPQSQKNDSVPGGGTTPGGIVTGDGIGGHQELDDIDPISACGLKEEWDSGPIPPPPPRRIGGAIMFGPRGHLDLDIEGLGVLDTAWRNTNSSVEISNIPPACPTGGLKVGDSCAGKETKRKSLIQKSSPKPSTPRPPSPCKGRSMGILNFTRGRGNGNGNGNGSGYGSGGGSGSGSGRGGSSIASATSITTPDGFLKGVLRKSVSEEVLVGPTRLHHFLSSRERSSDRDTARSVR